MNKKTYPYTEETRITEDVWQVTTHITHNRTESAQYRTRGKFLWFPKSIEGQTRWLVDAYWKECRYEYLSINWFNPILDGCVSGWSDWKPLNWI